MRSFRNVMVGGLLAAVCLAQAAGAQEESGKPEQKETIDPKTTTRLTLGSSSGTPGASVVVPLYFTPAQGVDVGRLKLEVDYVSANLKFTKLDVGIAAEMGGVDLQIEAKDGKNEKDVETQTLRITASFLSPEPPKKGIPPGLLAYLTMKISENGRPASITLRAAAEASELGTNKPLQNVRAFEAKVDVLAPGTQPLVTCFFFTH